MNTVYISKKQFAYEHLDSFFGEIVSVLKYLIPIFLGIMTMLIYFAAFPLSILAIVFTVINRNYNKLRAGSRLLYHLRYVGFGL